MKGACVFAPERRQLDPGGRLRRCRSLLEVDPHLKEVARLAVTELPEQSNGGEVLRHTTGAQEDRPHFACTPFGARQEPCRQTSARDLRMNRRPVGALTSTLDHGTTADRCPPALATASRAVYAGVAPEVGEVGRLGVRASKRALLRAHDGLRRVEIRRRRVTDLEPLRKQAAYRTSRPRRRHTYRRARRDVWPPSDSRRRRRGRRGACLAGRTRRTRAAAAHGRDRASATACARRAR